MRSSRVRNKKVLLPPRKVYWRYRLTVRTLQRLGAVRVKQCVTRLDGPIALATIRLRPEVLPATLGSLACMARIDPHRYVSHVKAKAATRLLELLQWHIDKELQ